MVLRPELKYWTKRYRSTGRIYDREGVLAQEIKNTLPITCYNKFSKLNNSKIIISYRWRKLRKLNFVQFRIMASLSTIAASFAYHRHYKSLTLTAVFCKREPVALLHAQTRSLHNYYARHLDTKLK